MKLGFLDLPPEERRLYIEQAATRRNVSPVKRPRRHVWLVRKTAAWTLTLTRTR
jgi:hypothetical protein